MSASDLQGIPAAVLFSFRPTQHRRRRAEKLADHDAINYTLKSPLSLRAARRYAAALSFQKCAVLGLLNAPPNHLGEGPATSGLVGLRCEFTYFLKVQSIIPQKEYRRRVFKQVSIAGPRRRADWQPQGSGVWSIGFVKEPLATQLSL